MKKSELIFFALVLLFSLPTIALSWGKEEPTAIIVDNDTGQPIEGAAAVAQWIGHSWTKRAWWEGGTDYLIKAKESFSDKDGKVTIDGFWGTNIISQKPRLTVYKPGYVVWDSKVIFLFGERKPEDFNENQRIIKLLKFDKVAPIIMKKHNTIKYPHMEHQSFLGTCLDRETPDKYGPGTIKIENIFNAHEWPFIMAEGKELSKENKLKRKK